MRGIIPRAMQQVGQYKTDLESQGWVYEMEVTFIEIYNESIRDLLRHGSSNDLKHEIKRDTNGNTTITDIVTMPINPNDESEIDGIMQLAARHRSVSSTAMNEQSSRSHSVFCLHLKATNASQGTVLKGSLSLVDLAGSERLDRSGATGAQAKETMAINKSLSSLTDVFVAIGNKQSHIPFRNSKLTYLLQPALSGDGKTLMVTAHTNNMTFSIAIALLIDNIDHYHRYF
jgi:kinesin family member C1